MTYKRIREIQERLKKRSDKMANRSGGAHEEFICDDLVSILDDYVEMKCDAALKCREEKP